MQQYIEISKEFKDSKSKKRSLYYLLSHYKEKEFYTKEEKSSVHYYNLGLYFDSFGHKSY